ncbi:Cell fate regulator YlbF, YheA/YmcA/DUF963 family (controls sporulation, competence, biofilm development) [Desulfurobacterium pacificum]|jgi:cell fate (sporulation/competence/biofilm development) regulator YlbF (YheA/YmcA/DUF963 family)|uniref:Cell fate regulator YlbF, YheA/YmcA/DUF963 family (Controls sporulation, competence, biofilm development) n=1 Tax=Desulfurobacterium pacificum TaxID=240166 RepID=A0ABY1NR26_9BACT|nr:YlbF family regulator [Desulfurobacterium pacificum]SMP15171.1 Cell fate regulator YlbF, YheA/YmcA/DUF963 family (controls sporulation, competence, biofilm development) [Desulfurobacterium pacificum]
MSAEVIKKASELAQAIAQSEELKALREAEAKLQKDPEAMKLLNEVQRLQQMAQMSGTPEALKELEEAFKKFSENEVAKAYLEANEKFAHMIQTVNSLLQEAIEGPKPHGHQCSGCSGCSL